MKTYTMIVKTETADHKGKLKVTTDRIPNVIEDQVNERRQAARLSAPAGATRTIKVVAER